MKDSNNLTRGRMYIIMRRSEPLALWNAVLSISQVEGNHMIVDLRFDKPNAGFRYTHDVLWFGSLVGQATEVQPASDHSYTWHAHVTFYDTTAAHSAISSDDVQPTVHCHHAPGHPKPAPPNRLTSQPVFLRTPEHGGYIVIQQKAHPTPIPGVDSLNEDDIAVARQVHKAVIAW